MQALHSNPHQPSTSIEDVLALVNEVRSEIEGSDHALKSAQKAIEDAVETEKARGEMLREAHAIIQDFSRKVQASRMKGSREKVAPESVHHADLMEDMDRRQYTVGASIQDMENEVSSLQGAVKKLRMEALELESTFYSSTARGDSGAGAGAASSRRRASSRTSGRHGDEDMLDDEENIMDNSADAAAALRLQMYKALGIEMIENEVGTYSKARIRSASKHDVHLVTLDDQLTPYFQTNLIWEFAS